MPDTGTGTFDFPPHKRGDTIEAYTFAFTFDNGVTIASGRTQLRTATNEFVSELTTTVDGTGLNVTVGPVEASVSRTFPIQTLYYDIEFVLSTGITHTLLEGALPITKDRTRPL